MARKRPSLRNYLIDGDQARDVLPVIDPPSSSEDISRSIFAEDVLSVCPTEQLDPSVWAIAVAVHLMELKQNYLSLPDLTRLFPMVKEEEINSILERAVSLNVLSLDDEKEIHLNSSSSWSSMCDQAPSWTDDLSAMMVDEDRNMWLNLLSQSSLAPLDLDGIRVSFDCADQVSDQFFMMRKAGEALLPITRQSQIRLPLVAVIRWSETGESTVFFGDAP